MELTDFIKNAHPRMKDHQKLLRNLMILEMVKEILEKFDHNAPRAEWVVFELAIRTLVNICHTLCCSIYRPACQACYNLMEVYLLGRSR